MPDEIFGERVCLYAELQPGSTLELDSVVGHLRERGVSPEWYPERLVVVDALPRASGGKVAKGELRADIRRRIADADARDGAGAGAGAGTGAASEGAGQNP
jgi:acyl-CoA synthetase